MGLYEFTQRHAGKLVLVGTICLTGSLYGLNNKSRQYDLFVNEIKQSVPEYARLEKVNKDISDLEKELNKNITFRDLITLTNPEDSKRDKYLVMQREYGSLQEEQRVLMLNPQVKNGDQVIKDKRDETNLLWLGISFASSIPLSFGITELMARSREPRKQKPFLK